MNNKPPDVAPPLDGLRQLVEQWRAMESANKYAGADMAAIGYERCADQLAALIAGLSPEETPQENKDQSRVDDSQYGARSGTAASNESDPAVYEVLAPYVLGGWAASVADRAGLWLTVKRAIDASPVGEATVREWQSALLSGGSPQEDRAPHLDDSRCAVCGWPLQLSVKDGCVQGNCSMRPLPTRLYDRERAIREHGKHAPASWATPDVPQEEPPPSR